MTAGPRGRRIVVTGASGQLGLPLSVALAEHNDVTAVARFGDPAARAELAAHGVRTVSWDLRDPDLSPLPADADVVFHAGAVTGRLPRGDRPGPGKQHLSPGDTGEVMESNVQATGRLMARYRGCAAFVHCSSASVYAYQGQRPLREEDPYGLHNTLEVYAASKVAAESVVEFAAREFGVPAVILRIFSLYGPRGGAPSHQIGLIAAGRPVPIYPGGPNRFNLIHQSDYVEKMMRVAELASVPPLVLNFAGSETMAVEDYCRYAAELIGREVSFVESDQMYWPLWADVTKMERLIGPTRVPVRDGVRALVEEWSRARGAPGRPGRPG